MITAEDREFISRQMEEYLKSLSTAVAMYKAGSDCERGYMLEKAKKLLRLCEDGSNF